MRDILNLFDDLLVEANLAAGEIPPRKKSKVINPKTNKPFSRPELFLYKVITGSPFTRLDGSQVVIDPKEAKNVQAWIASGPSGVITMRTKDGSTVKNTDLHKTVEFGSKESETIKIKGSDVFDVKDQEILDLGNNIQNLLQAGGFPASEMYSKIADNPRLKAMGRIGDAIIYLSRQAAEGKTPEFPKDLTKQEIKAIELYASEYIGVLGLVAGGVKWIRGDRQQFEDFVGGKMSDMIMYFPKSVSNPLADSFSVVNDENGHAIKISSKAAGKGAPPSLGSMKLPQEVRKKYPKAAEFLDIAQDPSLTQFTQPFAMMNYLYQLKSSLVPKAYHSMLPFTSQTVTQLEQSFKTGSPLPRSLMRNFEKQLSDRVLKTDASDGGKAWYAVTADVMRAVNTDRAVPELRAALIESLGYNFIQLYTNVRDNKLITEAFWPAKISGQVKLKTKGSAGEIKGKMNVEISPGDDEIEEPAGITGDMPEKEIDLDQEIERKRLTGPGVKAAKLATRKPADSEKALGRTRRKSK